MVDEATKKTLAAIPLCTTRAGPRDGEQWVTRLKEEYTSLIKVVKTHCVYIVFTLWVTLDTFIPCTHTYSIFQLSVAGCLEFPSYIVL